jgi:hypothetical protein
MRLRHIQDAKLAAPVQQREGESREAKKRSERRAERRVGDGDGERERD